MRNGMVRIGVIMAPIIALLAGATAFAEGVDTPVIDKRVLNQERRIQDGLNTGELTGREAGRLDTRLAKIEKGEARAKSDGQVTKQERRRLNRALNRNSRAIYKQKHDAQHR